MTSIYGTLLKARNAIASLPIDAFGWGEEPHDLLGKNVFPIRDALLDELTEALAQVRSVAPATAAREDGAA